mmetsp:Transcript_39616/g.93034  ORF Transcript_39616/g.93034 Transcript_39616/m.93034 type:complete len:207 (-) Transcript_39616:2046-2666(-)
MSKDEVDADTKRYEQLLLSSNVRDILLAFQESEPGLWEAEGGDDLLMAHDDNILALRVLRLEHASSRSLTKSAGGADVSEVKDKLEAKDGIPPDQHCLMLRTPASAVGRAGVVLGKGKQPAVALNLPAALQRIVLHVTFPGAAHRHRVALDSPDAGARRLAIVATVSRAWWEVIKSPGCNTAWELASRLRWPNIPKNLSVTSWRSL